MPRARPTDRTRAFARLRSLAACGSLAIVGSSVAAAPETAGWPVTGGDAGSSRYSPLADIHRGNVATLEVAWTYRHGDYRSGGILPGRDFRGTAFESTPILVDGRLIFTTPYNRVIALDPESGAELWSFDPKIPKGRFFANMMISRGVAHWRAAHANEACSSRVFLATLDARLFAINAASGRPCRDFGAAGTVDLLAGVEHLVDPTEYNVTSPPTVVGNVVIVGSSIADGVRRIMPSGSVRAFDARTGAPLWRFNTIPHADEFGAKTWEEESWRRHGGANVWSTITADLARGLVFLPVSTAGPDFHGIDRPGANLFVDSVVALEAATGRYVWHFQTVHHDLWDYDLAAPPNLVTVRRDGRKVDAVAQATKTGFVFLLERETGAPLFPVEERPVPKSDIPGEASWPTQPFPLAPLPLTPQRLREDDLWGTDARHGKKCAEALRAHDALTGEVLATFDLPAGLHAGPVTYKLKPNGKQYLVIAPGGHVNLRTKLGDYVIAYTLPD